MPFLRKPFRALTAAASLLIVGALLPSAFTPARAATNISIRGHGWGHGRGLGQFGALGYAVDKGWSSDAILNHYYGGTTAGSQAPDVPISVRMTAVDGMATTVIQERGHLLTGADDFVGGKRLRPGIKIERVGPSSWRVYDGSKCEGPWTARPALITAPSIVIYPDTKNDDRQEMLTLCEPGAARWLRDTLTVTEIEGSQRTVNTLAMDLYLRGVVPRESPASWADLGGGKGMQALKAQAVAARSYAQSEGRYAYAKTCDTTTCQVYKGRAEQIGTVFRDLEDPRSDAAIAQTAGQVRIKNGAVAHTEFSSSTGGYTAGGVFPAVPDDGDTISINPNHNWTTTLSSTALETKYQKGTFQSATVLARNGLGEDGGRVTSLRLKFSGGSVDTTGAAFQGAFGLKSDWFVLSAGPVFTYPYDSQGGTLLDAPAAVSWGANRIDTLVEGPDRAVWHKTYDLGAGGWGPYRLVGGTITAGPAVATMGPGTLEAFVRGTDNQLWYKHFSGGAWTPGNWAPLGGSLTSKPAVIALNGHLELFIRGPDNSLWYKYYGGWQTGWTGFSRIGGTLTSAPAVTGFPSGRIDVFVRGTDNGIWWKTFNGTSWGPYVSLGGNITSDPTAVARADGRIDLFARGSDNSLVHKYFEAGAWSDWIGRGGVLTSAPAVSSWSPTRLDVFVRGTDNAMWHTSSSS